MAEVDNQNNQDQHFCLTWNNFQANIASQFETLRYNGDFTDVTIACEGKRLEAHKVVLSACSPYFKELLKSNPCSHPIIFMRDVEVRHIVWLIEFMYAGEVKVTQTQLSKFLKTADSLKIRGLTEDSSMENDSPVEKHQSDNTETLQQTDNQSKNKHKLSPTPTSVEHQDNSIAPVNISSPLPKRQCKADNSIKPMNDEPLTINPYAIQCLTLNESKGQVHYENSLVPKEETSGYITEDDEHRTISNLANFYQRNEINGGTNMAPETPSSNYQKDSGTDYINSQQGNDNQKLHSLDPRPCSKCGKTYSNLSNLRQHIKLIHFPNFVVCIQCKKRFKSDLYLRRHIVTVHKTIGSNDNVLCGAGGGGGASGGGGGTSQNTLEISNQTFNANDTYGRNFINTKSDFSY